MDIKITTKRLILRAFQEKDVFDVYAFSANPQVAEPAGWKPHQCIGDAKEILDRILMSANEWAIEHKKDVKVIGSVSFSEDLFIKGKQVVMLGYLLHEDYWNQGYMQEALQALLANIKKDYTIYAYHFPGNKASQCVLENLGFQQLAYLPQSFQHYSGVYYDLYQYQYVLHR
ncbi:MAG: GNAT family N-acetyltransferase [Breznakia sp.]